MDPERESRAEEIFIEALEMPGERWQDFVSRRCGGDRELLEYVTAWLELHQAGHQLGAQIRQWISAAADSATEAPGRQEISTTLDPLLGVQIGSYRLMRLLGRGGMGRVYLAERCEGDFEQRVAIKLLLHASDSEDILRRFLLERQLLASLEHPNIARIYAAGSMPDGMPYFIMEYVDGIDIDLYCDALALDVHGRLELFRSVCAAVHYAHRNRVVHRDLKPGNILVDRNGQPRLLDFGIAKTLEPDLVRGSARTVTRLRRYTWQFASPEQVRGGVITTASDVYSLGVLLYELLTGRSPYEELAGRDVSSEHIVCDHEPQPPSVMACTPTLDHELGQVPRRSGSFLAALRRTNPQKLSRLLKGDLDTIVLKAMHKEPERRYAFAGELEQDVHRHIVGLTVIARPDTLGYRLSRFVRRNRVVVAAVAMAFAALATGFGVSVVQYARAVRAGAEAKWEAYTSRIAAAESAIRTSRIAEARRQLEATPAGFRGWEWRHLRSRLDHSRVSIEAHAAAITDVVFADKDQRVITCAEDRLIKVWDAQSGEASASLGPLPSVPRFLAVQPNSTLVAVGCDSGVVFVLDRNNHILARLEDSRQRGELYRLGHSAYEEDSEIVTLNRPLLAPTVDIDPTGSLLAAGFYTGAVGLWRVPAAQSIANWTSSGSPGRTLVAFAPDGATLATGSMAGNTPVRLWDLQSHRLLGELGSADEGQGSLVFAPDGQRLVWATVDGAIEFWSLREPRMELRMGSPGGSIRSLAFDGKGESIFTVATDQRLIAWDASSGRAKASFLGHTAGIQALAVSLDGSKIVSGDWQGVLKLWDAGTQDVRTFRVPGLPMRRNWAEAAVLTHDGSRLVSTLPPADVAPILQIWELWTGRDYSAPLGPKALCLAVCPGDSTVITGGIDGFVALVDIRTGAVLWMAKAHADDVRSVAIHATGRYFATGAHDSLVKLWDFENPQVVRVLRGHKGAVYGVEFAPSAGVLASCSQDSTIRIWDSDSGELLRVLRGHRGEVREVAFAPDGRSLTSASADGSVNLWDTTRGSLVGTLLRTPSPLYALAFAKDGSRVGAGDMDGIVHLLDPRGRREVARLFGHEGRILDLRFATIDEILVSTSLDGTIRLWDTGAAIPRPGVAATALPHSPAGAIGLWCAEGNARDSLAGEDGTLERGAGFSRGIVGQAFALDGDDAHVSIPDSPTLRPTSLSVAGWFMFDSTDRSRVLLSKSLHERSHTFSVAWGAGLLQGTVGDSITWNHDVITAQFRPAPGTWHHVACVIDADAHLLALYVDGVMLAVGLRTEALIYGDHPWMIGWGGGAGSGFPGCIDEVTLFGRALVPGDVRALFAAGREARCARSLLSSPALPRKPGA